MKLREFVVNHAKDARGPWARPYESYWINPFSEKLIVYGRGICLHGSEEVKSPLSYLEKTFGTLVEIIGIMTSFSELESRLE